MIEVKTLLSWLIFLFFLSGLAQANDNEVGAKQRFKSTTTLFQPDDVAIIVNDADQTSVNLANYYREARHIPEKNIIHVYLSNPTPTITRGQFERLNLAINKQLTSQHKIVAFAWTAPFAVECNSITSAFTLGFDPEICKNTCGASKPNPYFNQSTKNPFEVLGLRLSILMPSHLFEVTKKYIDRGVLSDAGVFKASAYYLQTSDAARSSRAAYFPKNGLSIPRTGLAVVNMKADKLLNVQDIMIYQTGLPWVSDLETLNFLPGALADHLTSFGGDLYGKGQMNAVRWLEAGATASYGTVTEPCNYWQKFPNSAVLLQWYVSGATAIEAYWKSVAWPAQGLFVGEPLAAPYAN